MPRLVLQFDRPDQRTTEQIYTLGQLLPEPLSLGAMSAEYWVSYPEWFGETKARAAVRAGIATAELDLVGLDS